MQQAWDTDPAQAGGRGKGQTGYQTENRTKARGPERPRVKIIVATHKKYRMPDDPMYLPLHIGAAVEKDRHGKEPRLGYQKDNEGENISARNPYFCELTGLFWAWKHVDADYIGLVHYRRHFKGKGKGEEVWDRILKSAELEPMLDRYKIFLPKKQYYIIETLASHYAHTHYIEHLQKTRDILTKKYPEYVSTFDDVMKRRSGHMFNMMIMEHDLLDEYCTWLFDILFTLEGQVDIRNYSFFQGRYCGRVGEIILNVWVEHQIRTGRVKKDEVKTLPYLYTEKVNWVKKGSRFLKAKFMNQKYEA